MRRALACLVVGFSLLTPAFADEADDLAKALNGGDNSPASPAPNSPAPNPPPPGTADYARAKETFAGLSQTVRSTQQIALTGLGHLYAVPNEEFNTRIFKATQDFQAANNLPVTGVLDEATRDLILKKVTPLMRAWQFRRFEVSKGVTIWLPVGPDFREYALDVGEGYTYTDDDGKDVMEIHVMRVKDSVHSAFIALLNAVPGAVVGYKVERPTWCVINSDTMEKGEKVTRYTRVQYNKNSGGVVGITVIYSGDHDPLLAGRVATIIADSLAASTMGTFMVIPPTQKQLMGD